MTRFRLAFCLVSLVAFAAALAARPAAAEDPVKPAPVEPVKGERRVWDGGGGDSKWATPANWTGDVVPLPEDDAVFDATSPKDCSIDAPMTVHHLVVTPEYKGTLRILSPATVTGSLTLAGKLEMKFDPRKVFSVAGPAIDCSCLREAKVAFAQGAITLAATEGTQRLVPPADAAVVLPEIKKTKGGTLQVAGPLNTIALYVEPGATTDLAGNNVTAKLLGIGGLVQGLGGCTITVTGAVGYTNNGFGFLRGVKSKETLDLAPEKPWTLLVKPETKWLADKGTGPFTIYSAKVGNCNAAGGEEVRAEKSSDAGGNKNVLFVADPPAPVKPAG